MSATFKIPSRGMIELEALKNGVSPDWLAGFYERLAQVEPIDIVGDMETGVIEVKSPVGLVRRITL